MSERLKSPEDWYEEVTTKCGSEMRLGYPCADCVRNTIAEMQAETYAVGFKDGFVPSEIERTHLATIIERAYERRKPE